VSHVRSTPVEHRFAYAHTLLALDVDGLAQAFDGVPFASVERPNLVSLRRRDYLGDAQVPLAEAVRARVREVLPSLRAGPITLLTQPRVLGFVFNPVSFYLLHEPDGVGLQAIVAEITNTPWNERHAYALSVARAERSGERLRFRFDKAFHVSPFLEMDVEYVWDFTLAGERLQVGMSCLRARREVFRADYLARREPLSARGLARALLAQPALSLSAFAAIYWQALRLRLKGAPFHVHPAKRVERAGALR
jgi:hypothetical protein